MPGSASDRYQIIQRYTVGWTGVQYLAIDSETGRQVLLKPLPLNPGRGYPESMPAFIGFSHPHVVEASDLLENEGVLYVVTEHVPATTLAAGGQREVSFAMAVALDCLEALVACESAGFRHGNLKPENIVLLEPPGMRWQAKLLEPGFAELIVPAAWYAIGKLSPLTEDFLFAAPERFEDYSISAQSDLFGLGACLYFALTGQAPFPGSTPMEVQQAHAKPVVPIHAFRDDVPQGFENWILGLMAEHPADRPESLHAALESIRTATRRDPASRSVASATWQDTPPPGGSAQADATSATPGPTAGGAGPRPGASQLAKAKATPEPKRAAANPPSLAKFYLLAWGALIVGIALGVAGTLAWQKSARARAGGDWFAPSVQSTIVLNASEAKLVGTLLTRDATGTLISWQTPSEYPEWPVKIVRPGTFNVDLEYSLDPSNPTAESTFVIHLGGAKLEGKIAGTGTWTDFKSVRVGQIFLKDDGSHVLQIKPVSVGGASLMHLRSITLTPEQ